MSTESYTLREICKDITIELIRKTGIQEWQDARTTKDIAKRAVEMTKQIQESFPSK